MAYTDLHLFFDDLTVNAEFRSGGRTISEADIMTFAGFSGDFNPIHVDPEYAKTTAFRQPIAHGYGIFSIASGLSVASPPVRTLALLSIRNWQFLLPVFIGDSIHVMTIVRELIPKGRGKRGEVVWQRSVINQDNRTVQSGEIVTLVEGRAPR